MTTTEIFTVILWWAILFLIGIASLPLTYQFFSRLPDRGYIFSKIAGLSVLSYSLFLLSTLHILPFTQLSVAMLLILVFVLMLGLTGKVKKRSFSLEKNYLFHLKNNWIIFICEEILFLAALFFWTWIRGFNPDIHGLEKFMDFGFVNSILRTTYFPTTDMWFPPYPINYYYFGHLTTAVLTKLSGIPSNISFNLMLGTLFAFAFTGAFSLGLAFYQYFLEKTKAIAFKSIIAGLISGFFLTFAGNLHTIYAFFKAYNTDNPVPPWNLQFLPSTFPNSYWYPNATRFIYHTIHEFPIYSFVVSDLHGHVLDIPFVLLTIATLFVVFIRKRDVVLPSKTTTLTTVAGETVRQWKGEIVVISFLLAVLYMTNAWDGFIYFLLTTLVLFMSRYDKRHEKFFYPVTALLLALIGLGTYIFSLPFSHYFNPSQLVSGIGVLCAPPILTKIGHLGPFLFEADHCQQSPWWQLLILYGFFYFFIFSFFTYLLQKTGVSLLKLSAVVIVGIATLFIHPLLLLLWIACIVVFLLSKLEFSEVDLFMICLALLSVFLIVLPEFFYAKDIYPAHYRANTMFKLVYQSFMMLSLFSGYVLFRLLYVIKQKDVFLRYSSIILPWSILAIFGISLVAVYPYFAISSYYNNLQTYRGLDGTQYLKQLYPTDYEAIQWINKNIKGRPVILEAQGDSYTDYARVSANTGLPTVLGWTVHEWLWRGSYSVPAPRIADVQTMYESTNLEQTKSLIKKYNVTYVFLGDLERQKYPTLDAEKFNQLGKVVYENGQTKIYKLL